MQKLAKFGLRNCNDKIFIVWLRMSIVIYVFKKKDETLDQIADGIMMHFIDFDPLNPNTF